MAVNSNLWDRSRCSALRFQRGDARFRHGYRVIGEQPAMCEPSVPLREAARRMVEHGASCVLVGLEDGEFGILTDHDLRSRVIAEGLSLETPVRDVLTKASALL